MEIYDFDMVYNYVHDYGFEKYFRQQYHILTKDHEELYYFNKIDYILDSYRMRTIAGEIPVDAIAKAVSHTLDLLVESDFNKRFDFDDE